MWTDRFAILPVIESESMEDTEPAQISELYILPSSVTAYSPTDISYVDAGGDIINMSGVICYTKEDVYTVALTVEHFESEMNKKYK